MRKWLFIAGVNGAIAVLAGAFGAHALAGRPYVSAFETGAHYHLVHAVAMAIAALTARGAAKARAERAALLFLTGIILFSGSLYLLGTTGIRAFGYVTPVGGVALIAAWILLALAGLKLEEEK